MNLSPPPVPGKLRELLSAYPEHIERLQLAMDRAASEAGASTPRIEHIVWALEDCLEGFVASARVELDAAKAKGSADGIRHAEAKEMLMLRAALKQQWIGDSGLLDFLERDEAKMKPLAMLEDVACAGVKV